LVIYNSSLTIIATVSLQAAIRRSNEKPIQVIARPPQNDRITINTRHILKTQVGHHIEVEERLQTSGDRSCCPSHCPARKAPPTSPHQNLARIQQRHLHSRTLLHLNRALTTVPYVPAAISPSSGRFLTDNHQTPWVMPAAGQTAPPTPLY
jgi:hypothetical protein